MVSKKKFALVFAFLGLIGLLAANTVSWAFYALLTTNSTSFFESIGIEDPNIQLISVIAVGVIILAVLIVVGVKKKDVLLDVLT